MSRPMPYVPMHPPRKPVSEDRMREILKSRSDNAAHVAQSPQAKEAQSVLPKASNAVAPLQWQKLIITSPGSGHMYSVCRRYRVDKIVSQTIVQYTVWRLFEVRGELNRRLGCVAEAPAAKAIAQADADAKAAA